MKVTNWYKNGDLNAFHRFCTENKRKLISIQLINPKIEGKVSLKGILYDHRLEPSIMAGVYILLTNVVAHPAFYALSDIESLHYLAPVFQASSVIPLSTEGLTYLV